MSIENAKKFISRAMSDKQVRDQMNAASTSGELTTILENHDMAFTYTEFNEAYTTFLTQCQSEEKANEIKELKMWWDLIQSMIQK
jgi:hypothetical protein